MSKLFSYIGGGIFLILVVIFMADYFLNIPLMRSIPGIGQIACQFPTTVSGNSMEPAIKAGSRITFNKCFENEQSSSANKENLAVGTVILYGGERGSTISRIKEKIQNQDRFIYKVSQDSRQDVVFEVRPDRIIGILE